MSRFLDEASFNVSLQFSHGIHSTYLKLEDCSHLSVSFMLLDDDAKCQNVETSNLGDFKSLGNGNVTSIETILLSGMNVPFCEGY